jgi:hypothetical protein
MGSKKFLVAHLWYFINVYTKNLKAKLEEIFGHPLHKIIAPWTINKIIKWDHLLHYCPLNSKHNNKKGSFFFSNFFFFKGFSRCWSFLHYSCLLIVHFSLVFFHKFFFQPWKVIHMMEITHNHKGEIKKIKRCGPPFHDWNLNSWTFFENVQL